MSPASWRQRLVFWPTIVLLCVALAAGVVQSVRFDKRLPRIELDYGWYLDALRSRGDGDGFVHGMQVALSIDDGMDAAGGEKILGGYYSDGRRLVDASRHYARAVDRNPDDAEARFLLGTTLLQMNRADEALPHLQEASRLQPDDPHSRTNLGLALAQTGRLPEAIDEFQALVRLQPDVARNHSLLAMALQSAGRIDDARRHCAEALRLEPDDPGLQEQCAGLDGRP